MSDGQINITPQPPRTGRFVDEAIAFIVAETHAQAQDAAELINVDYRLYRQIGQRMPHRPTHFVEG